MKPSPAFLFLLFIAGCSTNPTATKKQVGDWQNLFDEKWHVGMDGKEKWRLPML